MMKTGFWLGSFGVLSLSLGIAARSPEARVPEPLASGRPDRPEFYAAGVYSEYEVLDADEALGKPDGKYAEILPGGELVVILEKKLFYSPTIGGTGAIDSGSIAGRGGDDIEIEGWFPVRDDEGRLRRRWLPLGISGTGFLISPTPEMISPVEGSSGVDMLRITNYGAASQFVDAVIGYELRPSHL